MRVTAEEALVTRWERGLTFNPPFFLCCMFTLDPKANSQGYIQDVLCSMRCCKPAAPLLAEIIGVPGIEAVRFSGGRISVALLPCADRDAITKRILEILLPHPI